jgi:hypothetical protein
MSTTGVPKKLNLLGEEPNLLRVNRRVLFVKRIIADVRLSGIASRP